MKKSKARVTLADVADRAGVSVMTVSNVVNGRGVAVREETRRLVLRAVAALDYRPDVHARALRLSKSSTIGFVMGGRLNDFPSSSWISEMLSGLSGSLNDNGYGLLLHGGWRPGRSSLNTLARVDGFILLLSGPTAQRNEAIKCFADLRQPIIALQEPEHVWKRDIAVLRQDDFGGGVQLARHLVECGAKRVTYVGPISDWPAVKERVRGMSAVLRNRRGTKIRAIKCTNEYSDVERAITDECRVNGLPDAFIGTNEPTTLAALNIVESIGYAIPQDVMLAGFNASTLWSFAKRRITAVRFTPYTLGTRCAEIMINRLENKRFANPITVMPSELIVGTTT